MSVAPHLSESLERLKLHTEAAIMVHYRPLARCWAVVLVRYKEAEVLQQIGSKQVPVKGSIMEVVASENVPDDPTNSDTLDAVALRLMRKLRE